MSRSSPQLSDRATPVLTLLAGVLLGLVPACARPSATSAPAPETASAADLTSGKVEKRPHEPLESLIEGRMPGMQVTANPDGSISVRVQGVASFYAGTEPLFVIDGSPVTAGPGGTLRGINPNDIESIQVLRHPPDTSLYGVRGANGVIVITTKRPKRS